MAHCDCNTSVAEQMGSISSQKVADLSQYVTLKGRKTGSGRCRIQSSSPLTLEGWGILLRSGDVGQSRNLKDQVQLSQRLLVALPVAGVWIGDILLVYAKEGRPVKHWQEWLPFLEK